MHFTLIGHRLRRHVLFVETSPLWVYSLENREFDVSLQGGIFIVPYLQRYSSKIF